MSCLLVSLSRVGGGSADVTRIGGGIATLGRVGGAITSLERIGGMTAQLSRKGGLKCRFSPICASGIGSPYLEISPTILWMWADPVYNDVFSNTTWNVD